MSAVMEKKDEFTISVDQAVRYLNLYVGEVETPGGWKAQIQDLFAKASKKHGAEEAKEVVKKSIACSIMLPTFDKSAITTPPQNLLHWCRTWSQYNERDWVDLLRQEFERDAQIEKWRNQCLSLGVVDPIEYSPVTRQAFNWLFGKAQDMGVVTDENKADIVRRFKNLVLAYGGNVICYLFMKEEYKINKKVLNWRSNYFFEKLIFDTYSPEQVFKIKKQELAKTNPKLVKSVRI